MRAGWRAAGALRLSYGGMVRAQTQETFRSGRCQSSKLRARQRRPGFPDLGLIRGLLCLYLELQGESKARELVTL